ncbi:hypothetical protein ACQVTX_23705 [Bacillus pretiosus]|uniref:hypothetical protein n=1 Tax=Bacillus pretiosus TaxID=2983392 RepID=UPI003D649C45
MSVGKMKEDKVVVHPIIGEKPHTCIYCDEEIIVVTAEINYPNGKHAHLTCHLENNGDKLL